MKNTIALVLAFSSVIAPVQAADTKGELVSYASGKYALINVRLIDGSGSPAKDGSAILINGDRIEKVGSVETIDIPEGYQTIDIAGKTILPGMIFMHEHTFYPVGGLKPSSPPHQGAAIPRLLLAAGITTARTGGTVYPLQDLAMAKAIKAGKGVGADLDVTMPYIDEAHTFIFGIREVTSAVEAREHVAYWSKAGATSVKGFLNASRPILTAAIKEAHAQGIKVTGHLCAVTFREAAALGIDNLEHGFGSASDFSPGKKPDQCPRSRKVFPDPDDANAKSLIELLVKKGIAITLTPGVSERGGPEAPPLDALSLELMSPKAISQHTSFRNFIDGLEPEKLAADIKRNARIWALDKAFMDAGGVFMVGTDVSGGGGCVVGPCSHRSLEILVERGLEPMEVLTIATRNPARYLGREAEIGAITAGMRADLIIVDGYPDKNIKDIRKVETVFKSGIGYNSKALYESVKGLIGR